jgi:LysM repeat protein
MRTWTKSACVVLAWSILSVILMAAGPKGSINLAQANTRTSSSSSTEIILTSTLSVAAAPVTATSHTTKYVVQDGDTLSVIATRFAVHGGWPALYAANRRAIGPDPNVIYPGIVLVLPGQMTPVRYTVPTGDTLSRIAAEFAVPGGWPALYAANRQIIGPDPNVIRSGSVLTIPSPATASPPAPSRVHPPKPPSARPPSPSTAHRHHRVPTAKRAPTAAGMPQWLKTMLLAVGLLILAAFAAEPLLVVRRRRRQARAQAPARELRKVEPAPLPGPQRSCAEKAHIILADHDRLVVTRSRRDDTVYVLRPPGADPRAILRVARLVVPEGRYSELAEALGLPASWPME